MQANIEANIVDFWIANENSFAVYFTFKSPSKFNFDLNL